MNAIARPKPTSRSDELGPVVLGAPKLRTRKCGLSAHAAVLNFYVREAA
jgi:hypothetical protein